MTYSIFSSYLCLKQETVIRDIMISHAMSNIVLCENYMTKMFKLGIGKKKYRMVFIDNLSDSAINIPI